MAKKGKGRAQDSLLSSLTPEQQAEFVRLQAQLVGGGDVREDPPVFWGYSNAVDPETGDPVMGKRGIQNLEPFAVKESEALSEFDRWNQAKIKAFINEAVRAGLLPRDADYFQAKALWQALVSEARDRTAVGENMNPWDVMSLIGGDARLAGGQEKSQARTETRTEKQVNLLDPTEARAAAHDMISSMMGRRATEEEVDDFATTLNTFQKNHPTVQTTTTKYGKRGQVKSSSTVTSGGGDPSERLADEVRETDEYASYQAAGIYFPLLEQALGATANVDGL